MDTPVVLADEPTGSLDKNSGIKVMELLEGLHEQGKTLIIVTHDMDIAEHADRIIQIEDGKIVADTKKEYKKIFCLFLQYWICSSHSDINGVPSYIYRTVSPNIASEIFFLYDASSLSLLHFIV